MRRLVLSLALAAAMIPLVAPLPASARMHFTSTRERLEALSQRVDSSLGLTNPTEVQTQAREIVTQAQAAKAAAEEASGRPASNAEDKSVLASVVQEMDAVAASANRALSASGGDQRAALQDAKSRVDRTLSSVRTRIQAQLAAAPAAAGGPPTLPSSGGDPSPVSPVGALAAAGALALLVGLGTWLRARRRAEA